MSRSNKKIIGITLGDPAGIGPEVVAKSLVQTGIRNAARFRIIGHPEVYRRYAGKVPAGCELIAVDSRFSNIRPGRPTRESARASLQYLETAIDLLRNGEIDSLVTAPVSKEGICSLGKKFQGHTEFLAEAFKIKRFGMMFVTDRLKTIIVTRHIPLNQVSGAITSRNVYETVMLAAESLKKQFKIKNPHIAVCGLNPHAGEGGKIGREELTAIIPALRQAQKKSVRLTGPLAADTLFVSNNLKNYDAVVAMYHDQGLIPVKTLYFKEVVNLTVGLPFIRTSPAHGTAFNIAGKNMADPSSMTSAIRLAMRLSR